MHKPSSLIGISDPFRWFHDYNFKGTMCYPCNSNLERPDAEIPKGSAMTTRDVDKILELARSPLLSLDELMRLGDRIADSLGRSK